MCDVEQLIMQFEGILYQSDFALDPREHDLPAPLRDLANRAEVIRFTVPEAYLRPRMLALLDDAIQLLSQPADQP
jgi:hypothetical protein